MAESKAEGIISRVSTNRQERLLRENFLAAESGKSGRGGKSCKNTEEAEANRNAEQLLLDQQVQPLTEDNAAAASGNIL